MAEWLKEGLERKAAQVQPSPASWVTLSERLQAEGIAKPKRAPRRWLLALEVAAACLVLGLLVTFTQGRVPAGGVAPLKVKEHLISVNPHVDAQAFWGEVDEKEPRRVGGVPPHFLAVSQIQEFGYSLEPDFVDGAYRAHSQTLSYQQQTLLERVSRIGEVSLSGSGGDFITQLTVGGFYYHPEANTTYWLTQDGPRIVDEEMVVASRYRAPLFVGDRLLHVLHDQSGRLTVVELSKGCLRADAGECATFAVKEELFAMHVEIGTPFSFTKYGDQWVLDVAGDIYLDGASLREQGRFDRVFGWFLVEERPFYFAEKRGQIRPVWDGREFSQRYDEVLHGVCCELTGLNPSYTYGRLQFNARRGEQWLHVVLTAPDEDQ